MKNSSRWLFIFTAVKKYMSAIKQKLAKIINGLENTFDDLAFNFKKRLGWNDPLQIVLYRSYGSATRLYIKGRILEDKGIKKATQRDTLWNNLLNMYQRFESDEVPGAQLKVNFQNEEYLLTTDQEGYFVLFMSPKNPLTDTALWHEVDVELVDAPLPFVTGLKNTAHVLIPPPDAEYGIISDIDDTIVETSATNFLAMARNVFLHNAHTRLPFAGVSEFYRALQSGRNGKRNNPFFYVSSSPWNLYDLLTDFLDLNNIPPGPLLLRDVGLEGGKMGFSDHMAHKFNEIENILVTYPQLNFVLIGDSGQEDPKIYLEVVRKYPNRILAIYVRDVQLADREKIAIDLAYQLQEDKVEMVIVDNTVEAAEHAAKIGLIYTEEIVKIEEDKKQDKGEVPGKVDLNE
jgi:phosphatidate phosphatase APP1